MKFNVSCVYWILLLISVVSSGLLFMIVASEGVKVARDQSLDNVKGNFGSPTNVTIEDSGGGGFDPPEKFRSQIRADKEIADKDNAENFGSKRTNAENDLEKSRDGDKAENLPGLELFPEGLTQQPNLSQGVPETDQAVVLTLVDAAAAELQSLAGEPRISIDQLGGKSVVSNLTITALRDSDPSQLPSPSRLPTLASLDPEGSLETVRNLTKDNEQEQQEILDDQAPRYEEENVDVVIVRADQSGVGNEIPANVLINDEEVLPVGLTPTTDGLETTSELPEIEARARLASGAAEDAGIMLDVLVTGTGTDPHEDIPSFSEWAQKRLEEAEKKKTHPNASSQNPGGPGGRGTGSTKVRSKNYASPDCGSKIVAANPEAGSASSVLSSSRDEYMLNTCTSRVWFVVELCEAIQAEKIELANFELFSSSPKDFSVFVGDRFPSRDWSPVGQFTAKDERDIQSFALHPRLFGKFVKVELHSHYGAEHFCPVSLFRVYGTSEFEVLETENQIQESLGELDDEDEEEMLDVDTGDSPRNLFGSARDAVLSIVKKAAQVLVKSGDTVNNNTKIRESIEDTILQNSLIAACMTPRYSVLCNDCTETMFANVFQLVSCSDQYLAALLRIDFINSTLGHSSICPSQGVPTKETYEFRDLTVTLNNPGARFLASLFPPQYLVALCNVLAARESRVIVNTSYYVTGNNSEGAATLEDALIAPPQGVPTNYEASTASVSQHTAHCTSEDNSPACRTSGIPEPLKSAVEFSTPTYNEPAPSTENIAVLIKPTKTLTKDEGSGKEQKSEPLLEPSRKPVEESTFFEAPASSPSSPNQQATVIDKVIEEPGVQGSTFETASQSTPTTTSSVESHPEIPEPFPDSESAEAAVPDSEPEAEPEREQEPKISSQDQISLDTLLSDLKDLEADSVTMQNNPAAPSATLSQPTPTPQQKESVFLRLSNRIKTLERNMSLSGQYLEELSKRYKKQVEEMQRSLERAISAMGEESRRGEEREARRLEEIVDLKEQVSALTRSLSLLLSDRDSWRSKFSLIGQHVVLVCVEIVIVLLVLSYCRRTGELEDEETSATEPKITRRKSVEGTAKKTKRRRPSEIAAHISGTYRELLIDESVAPIEGPRKDRKRKRKRDAIGRVPVVTISDFPTIKPVRRESLNALPGGTNFPSRRASSSDASKCPEVSLTVSDIRKRPESAPENCSGWFSDQKSPDETLTVVSTTANEAKAISEEISDPRNSGTQDIPESRTPVEVLAAKKVSGRDSDPKIKAGGILKNRKLSSPAFMKTALGSRSKRLSGKSDSLGEPLVLLKSDNWEWYSRHSGSRSSQEDNRESPTPLATVRIEATESLNGSSTTTNGRHEDSDDSRSGSGTPTSGFRKDEKSYGLKKMVKKFF